MKAKMGSAIGNWLVTSAACVALAIAPAVFAHDDYEDGAGDDTASTTNELSGLGQDHDLEATGGVPDQDWFQVNVDHRRSYEVQVFAASGQVNLGVAGAVSVRTADGLTVIGSSQGSQAFANVRWINDTDSDFVQRARVSTGQTLLNDSSWYHIRLRETTLYCPRYNNSGTQSSVLIVQQTRQRPGNCAVNVYFYDQTTGQLNGTSYHALTPDNMLVLAAGSVPGVNGTRGHVRIANTCGLAGLRGKLVALEPSTGFSFDTACEVRDTR